MSVPGNPEGCQLAAVLERRALRVGHGFNQQLSEKLCFVSGHDFSRAVKTNFFEGYGLPRRSEP
jgi:hypothetical protein